MIVSAVLLLAAGNVTPNVRVADATQEDYKVIDVHSDYTAAFDFTERSPFTRLFTADTITNTEVDTLLLPVNVLTNYEAAVAVWIANLSGTSNLTIVVDEGWVDALGVQRWDVGQDTIVSASAAASVLVDIGRLAGRNYRIRITGSGTQSTRYSVSFFAKPV